MRLLRRRDWHVKTDKVYHVHAVQGGGIEFKIVCLEFRWQGIVIFQLRGSAITPEGRERVIDPIDRET
jgi:hypothetical protein